MRLTLEVLPYALALCRLPADALWPDSPAEPFVAVTRTPDETSIVCDQASTPPGARVESGWRALRVRGPLAFEVVGVVASVSTALANEGVPIFVISTFDTDYVLVKEQSLERAISALRLAGHDVTHS